MAPGSMNSRRFSPGSRAGQLSIGHGVDTLHLAETRMQVEPQPGGALVRVRVRVRMLVSMRLEQIREGCRNKQRWSTGGNRTVYVGKTGNCGSGRLRSYHRAQSINSDVESTLATSIDRHHNEKEQKNRILVFVSFSLFIVLPLMFCLLLCCLPLVAHFTTSLSTYRTTVAISAIPDFLIY